MPLTMDPARRNLLIGGSLLGAAALTGALPATCAGLRGGRKFALGERERPIRPPGEPQPLLDEDIAPVLARLDAWYATHLPPDRYVFNPPATEADLAAFERLVGLAMPSSYHQLYRWHDGENDDRLGHIYGLPLLPLKWVTSEWTTWNKVLAYFKGDRYQIPASSWPPGAADPAYINPRWIPLTQDGSG